MGISQHVLDQVARAYRRRYGVAAHWVDAGGVLLGGSDRYGLNNLPDLIEARRQALQEAVRWGEPFMFLTAPGLISWMAPVVDGETVLGGLVGGEVLAEDDPMERRRAAEWLVTAGARRDRVTAYMRTRAVWPKSRHREAAGFLMEDVYARTGYRPALLQRNRENAEQQRQIAEEIHEGKRRPGRGWGALIEDERRLLHVLQIGDRPGARRILNQVLASIFLYSPKLALVQARLVELVGYLVRVAMEADPLQDRLVRRHLQWIERLVAADEFGRLCETTREILDEFMDCLSPALPSASGQHVRRILEHMGQHYKEGVGLDELSRLTGLNRFHVSHLLRQATGATIPQHVRRLRVREACIQLETTDKSFSDIAYALGFADQSHFIRQFRAVMGMTPRTYREEGGARRPGML